MSPTIATAAARYYAAKERLDSLVPPRLRGEIARAIHEENARWVEWRNSLIKDGVDDVQDSTGDADSLGEI